MSLGVWGCSSLLSPPLHPPLGTQPPLNVPRWGQPCLIPPCGVLVPWDCAIPAITLSSDLLYLVFLSNLTACSCHSVIILGRDSTSANFLLIVLFSPLLNSSINALPLYLLPLAALLNSWTYSLQVLDPWTKSLSSSAFLLYSSNSPNSSLIFSNNSSIVSTSDVPFAISSKILSFHVSATPPCT